MASSTSRRSPAKRGRGTPPRRRVRQRPAPIPSWSSSCAPRLPLSPESPSAAGRRRRCSSTSRQGSPRTTSSPAPRRAFGAKARPRRHPRPVCDRTADRAPRPRGDPRAAAVHGAARRPTEATARFGAVSSTGDPEGEITETGRIPGPELALPTGEIRQHTPAYSAVKVGGERAYSRARRGEEFEMPERFVTVHRFELLERDGERGRVRDRVLVGHLRAQPDRRPRRRLLRAAAPDRDRPFFGRGGRRDEGRSRSPTRSPAFRVRGS